MNGNFITRAVLDMDSMLWESVERCEYDGPWALCDRAAQSAASTAAKTATGVAGNEESQATNASAALTPFYRSEMQAQHGFNPGQTQELLNYAGAGVGGSGAAATGEAASQAARTKYRVWPVRRGLHARCAAPPARRREACASRFPPRADRLRPEAPESRFRMHS